MALPYRVLLSRNRTSRDASTAADAYIQQWAPTAEKAIEGPGAPLAPALILDPYGPAPPVFGVYLPDRWKGRPEVGCGAAPP